MFYLLWCHYSSATKKKFKLVELFFSPANEVKSCGLVHQLILRMLKDLILLQHDSQLLNGNPSLYYLQWLFLKPGLGPWKTFTLKNLDPEKSRPRKIRALKNLQSQILNFLGTETPFLLRMLLEWTGPLWWM